MRRGALANLFRLPQWWNSRWQGWKRILPTRDERGITTIVAAMFMTTILLFLAILIDATGMLMRREQLTNMAELAAAAGGRVVAEAVAYAAAVHKPNPTPAEQEHAEQFVTAADRAAIEDGTYPLPGTTVGEAAQAEITKYALVNAPSNMNFDAEKDLTIKYVPDLNDCTDPDNKNVAISVNARSTYQFFFGGFLATLGMPDKMPVSATGTYQIVICP